MKRIKDYTKFKDMHKGETCITIANGPSLEEVPVEFLRKYPSFGVNRITQMAQTHDFMPTYYSCIGYNQLDTPEKRATIHPALEHVNCGGAFINRLWMHKFPYDNVWGIKSIADYDKSADTLFFSLDPLHIIGIRGTMMLPVFQLAYYMGFTTCLVVGLDH